MIEFIFYLLLFGLFYAYFGYPLLMSILMRFKKETRINKKNITPNISLVISAYNEESSIREKLENILSLDYPQEKMEVVVISDASIDNTDEIVKEFADRGVTLCKLEQRSGKIAAYRKVLTRLKGKIIVFSDATSLLSKDSVTHLISNFHDETVGCAGGLLAYANPENAIMGGGESEYWEYEKKIRKYESSLCSLASVSGTLYAVRKNLYPYDMKDYLADDLIVPLHVKKAGLRTVLEAKAICKEFTTLSAKEEMAKRIRITIQNIRGLIDYSEILNPLRYGLFSILVISHKLFRLMVPVLLLTLFVSNLFLALDSHIFLIILTAQIVLYLGGFAGYLLNKKAKLKMITTLFYFCLSNLAILIGIIRFFRGKKVVTWETIRPNG